MWVLAVIVMIIIIMKIASCPTWICRVSMAQDRLLAQLEGLGGRELEAGGGHVAGVGEGGVEGGPGQAHQHGVLAALQPPHHLHLLPRPHAQLARSLRRVVRRHPGHLPAQRLQQHVL